MLAVKPIDTLHCTADRDTQYCNTYRYMPLFWNPAHEATSVMSTGFGFLA